MKLAIISHTVHYRDSNGVIKGWGPTVRELNYLASKFDEIIHVACLHKGVPPDSCLPYESVNIRFVPLPPSGGKNIFEKLSAVTKLPEILREVNAVLPHVNFLQVRVPTGFANYLLPWLSLRKKSNRMWVKYAGNWNQQDAPAGYKFQRWWLRNNFLKCNVTINGNWPGQPAHCLTFENPCLDDQERQKGKSIVDEKNFTGHYAAIFIGRMEQEKGVGRILDALPAFNRKNIKEIHFIGDGKKLDDYKEQARKQDQVNCIFHGSVSRKKIGHFLENSHFLLLPSTASEGFPKVIAEGANYGVIPVVSGISSIGQYINDRNGFLWDITTPFSTWLDSLDFNESQLRMKSKNAFEFAEAFTFSAYYQKLKDYVLNDPESI